MPLSFAAAVEMNERTSTGYLESDLSSAFFVEKLYSWSLDAVYTGTKNVLNSNKLVGNENKPMTPVINLTNIIGDCECKFS